MTTSSQFDDDLDLSGLEPLAIDVCTIAAARLAKAELETDIARSIDRFTASTGLFVSDVNIGRSFTYGGGVGSHVFTTVELQCRHPRPDR